jgi:hypothetical protein
MEVISAIARNVAEDSGNPLHRPEVAAELGLSAPPIAGMTTIDYAAAALLKAWHGQWPSRAGLDCRLLRPIGSGAEIHLTIDELPAEARCTITEAGEAGASPLAVVSGWTTGSGLMAPWATAPEGTCEKRPPDTLVAPLRLGSWGVQDARAMNDEHLVEMASVCGASTLADFCSQDLLSPGALIDIANQVVMANIQTGIWTHARSRLQYHDHIRVEDVLTACSLVTEVRTHLKGLLVVLDISFLRLGQVAARLEHSAIL